MMQRIQGISNPRKYNHGFTMIEVIAILMILGIVVAVAISKSSSTDISRLLSEVETVKGHLRYAQSRSMSDDVPWGISCTSSSYSLLKDGVAASNLPNENSATHVLQNGVSITSGAGAISFDGWGSPGTSTISITLSDGNNSRAVTVTKNTGFIP